MEYEIRQLSQNAKIFFPQTSAEAVVVKHNGVVTTLDKVLDKKVETIITPNNSGLKQTRVNGEVIIEHVNKIQPTAKTLALKIQYDQNGHISASESLGKYAVMVDGLPFSVYDGENNVATNFDDSFKIEDNKIKINFKYLN